MIPHILHQTWKDEAVPSTFAKYRESWNRVLPQWNHKFWTDADLIEFVETRCPQFSSLFYSYPKPIMRIDLGRYLLLREFGGVYADIDTEALASVTPLLESSIPIFGLEPSSHASLDFIRNRGFRSIVSNAVILSPPSHPFWDHLLSILERCRSADNPIDATGPIVLTAAIELAESSMAPRVLPAHVFCPIDKFSVPVNWGQSRIKPIASHHWAGTWRDDAGDGTFARPDQSITMQQFSAKMMEADSFLRTIDRGLMGKPKPNNGRVLVAVPARDAADTLDRLFECLLALRYPRQDLSLAFLEGDSSDDTFSRLNDFAAHHADGFRRVEILKRDYNVRTPSPRWHPEMQRSRRSHIAKVRNELITQGLQNEDWVLWMDADIIKFPDDVISILQSVGGRIVHPNAVRIPGGVSMDLNAWVAERRIPPQHMAQMINDGLYQPPAHFHRLYLSDIRYRDVVLLDSVGGTMLLVDANLHRAGLLFPEKPYRFLIETEGFAQAACDLNVVPIGLPNLEIFHSAR